DPGVRVLFGGRLAAAAGSAARLTRSCSQAVAQSGQRAVCRDRWTARLRVLALSRLREPAVGPALHLGQDPLQVAPSLGEGVLDAHRGLRIDAPLHNLFRLQLL